MGQANLASVDPEYMVIVMWIHTPCPDRKIVLESFEIERGGSRSSTQLS